MPISEFWSPGIVSRTGRVLSTLHPHHSSTTWLTSSSRLHRKRPKHSDPPGSSVADLSREGRRTALLRMRVLTTCSLSAHAALLRTLGLVPFFRNRHSVSRSQLALMFLGVRATLPFSRPLPFTFLASGPDVSGCSFVRSVD